MKKWLARLGWVVLGLLIVVPIALMTWEPLFAAAGTARMISSPCRTWWR